MAVMHPTVTPAVESARSARAIAMKYPQGGLRDTMKPHKTPVPRGDQGGERAIRATLARGTRGCGFLGEEFGQEGSTPRRGIIDPIEGTKNFVRHIPFWAVLIALE